MADQEATFRAGSIEFTVEYRHFGGDEGPALRVYGQDQGRRVQLLRFDCFQRNPHYHFDPSGKDERLELSQEVTPDLVSWTLQQVRQNLKPMIRLAGYPHIADQVDSQAILQVLPEIEQKMRGG